MKNLRKHQLTAIGSSIAVLYGVLCLVAFASAASRTEKPAPVDAEQFADFMGHEVLDIQDLAGGAEVQRRMFNRITPPGLVWTQPMFPPVAPFDAQYFDDQFLDRLLGEDKNSVVIYPLSLIQDPKTRETLIYNAEGELIAAIPADGVSREWPEDADPSRVILQLDLLPAEDVEPYLYTERRIEETLARYNASRSAKSGGVATRGLEAGEFGICDIQGTTNGTMFITVTNGMNVAEVFAYTVWHTSSVVVVTWTNEQSNVVTDTNTVWHQVSPAFNGLESAWECLTTNLVLTNGVGIYEDANISSNARIRFYAVANRQDTDGDGLTDGMEIFVHHTNPGNPDTDGDGWSDGEELAAETNPLDRFSATKLARGVVLNEVLYNATGPDLGYEWIELYCAGRYPVNLGDFVIQVADTAYSNAYVFPSNTWIEPGRFLLLGGSNVTNCDLEVNFRMPNRFTNDPTAAVRLAAETGTNTVVVDCLMYGGSANNFNPHGLDTTGWISSNALSAGAGRSLYRRFNGHDTDQVLDWWYTDNPTPNPFADIPDSDGDGLTDQEELTGSRNPYGEPTNPHNADSDGDGLSDYAECITHGTNPNTWATDGDIYPWPPPSGAVSDWWGSDSYEIANGWNPLVFDENTNGIPDSWEMAFPGTNLYGHADNDGISNFDELMQNSDPSDSDSHTAQPYVIRYESSMPGWVNDGMTDIGLEGWVKTYFEGLKTDMDLCVWVQEGRTQEQFRVEWRGATQKGIHWLSDQEVVTSASATANTRPYLFVQDLGLHPDFTGKLGGEYKIIALSVEFLDASKNPVSTLKVGKWENAFNAGPTVKDNFIDLDPDRFHIRVNDQSKKGTGKVSVKLSTASAGMACDDDATEIELNEEPANSGIFISTNMLMVSDDVDDDFTNPNIVADDTKNDRTHKIAPGGKVKVQYPETGTVICEKEAVVPPDRKKVDVAVVILRDKAQVDGGTPVISDATVSSQWRAVQERYAQVGVTVNWTGPTIVDPPSGVDLSDYLTIRSPSTSTVLTPEGKSLIAGLGTTNTTADIHVLYVNQVCAGLNQLYGTAVADYWYAETEDAYTYNVVMSANARLLMPAHELGHLLTDAGYGGSVPKWNLMYDAAGYDFDNSAPTSSKRLNTEQESLIRSNSHCVIP